jgi:hypothetical protein
MGDGQEATDATTTGECLVALAARRALPAHPYIDAATVDWIASQEDEVAGPRGVSAPTIRPAIRRILRATPIPASWHAEEKVIDSIHGSHHLLRTSALAAILAERCGLNQADTETRSSRRPLMTAGAWRSCGRRYSRTSASRRPPRVGRLPSTIAPATSPGRTDFEHLLARAGDRQRERPSHLSDGP